MQTGCIKAFWLISGKTYCFLRYMKVLLQFPEGLKSKAMEYAKKLENEGDEVFISASSSYGACDLAIDEAKKINADKLIHFGHSEFMKVDFNVEYIEYPVSVSIDILKSSLGILQPFDKIGIVTTIQHVHMLDKIRKFFEENNKEVIIGKPYGFAKYPGQILGCDAGSAASIDNMVDAHIFFGGGLFHPLGALLATKKPFFSIDPFARKIERLDEYREKYAKKSMGKILSALHAKQFGILVSTKNGQYNMNTAKEIKRMLSDNGFYSIILITNTLDFDALNDFMDFDAFVNTMCPRIAIDDSERSRKPILSVKELEELLNIKKNIKNKEEKEIR
ncbi:MAG: diphthamide biosynthesis enzyme Dph2 [Candidatus Micrarchaeaceae archaeon]